MRIILITVTLLNVHFGILAQNEPTLEILPNPFVDTTTITFTLPATDTVSLYVYNQLGELMDSIINEQLIPQGAQSIQYVGDTLPIGQYIVVLDVDTHLVSKQMVKMGQLTLGSQRDQIQNTHFNLYPNPTSGMITVTDLSQDATRFTVYNALGKLVHNGDLNGSENLVIDLMKFPVGLYYLQLFEKERTLTNKIIKL